MCLFYTFNSCSECRADLSLLSPCLQVITDLYKSHWKSLSADTVTIIADIYSSIISHSHELNSQTILLQKLEKTCSILDLPELPMVHFENESYQNFVSFLHDLLTTNPSLSEEKNIEAELISACENVLKIYLDCAGFGPVSPKAANGPVVHCILPLGSAKKEELAARTPLVLTVMRILSSLERDSFRRYISRLFPLLVDLVRSEHSSREVQRVLSNIFESRIGPILMKF